MSSNSTKVRPRICLNMIVKNESAVIGRCLDSVLPLIDTWVIVDTGSTDGTQTLIQQKLANVPGRLFERPWVNFGHNRTEALELARTQGDYLLFIDADESLRFPAGFAWPDLGGDAYYLHTEYGATVYSRCALVSTRLQWHWSGVLHEFLVSTPTARIAQLEWPRIFVQHDGARARDPKTYEKDAAILEQALIDDPQNARYAFYLAQSWRDAGQPAKARDAYRRRAELSGWEEETWYAVYEVARMTELLNEPTDKVRSSYLDAYQLRPTRAEPLYQLARYHRERREWPLAFLFASQAVAIPRPADILFVDEGIYNWCRLDELGTAAYWVGAFEQGRQAIEKVLASGHLPPAHLTRIQTNLGLFPTVSQLAANVNTSVPSAKASTSSLRSLSSNIYEKDIWDGGSGPGSRLENVRNYHQYLQNFLRQHAIKSIVDCGCGDWQSTRYLDLTGIQYTGVDIVPSVIEANQRAYGKAGIAFACGNFSEMDLPCADLAICKDALQHLPDQSVAGFLQQMHKFRYVLITNDLGENTGRDVVLLSNPYHFAPLDVTRPPFLVRAERVCEMPGGKVTHLVRNAQPAAISSPRVPTVMMAILAKQKETSLPLYLRCIEALDYPKSAIALYIRTNNNTDQTANILRDWIERVGSQYASVEFDDSDVDVPVQQYGVHEWNPTRFKVLGHIRQVSLQKAIDAGSDFYLVVDVDNFVRPHTLRDLVSLNLPIVGPLLRHEDPNNPYSNYHHAIDANGYYADSEEYYWLLNQRIRGIAEVKVIHCTYLIRRDCLPLLRYDDGSQRHEYVVFSASARAAGFPQYLDTRQVYGFLTLDENARRCEELLGAELAGR